jgi:uncharacterized protein
LCAAKTSEAYPSNEGEADVVQARDPSFGRFVWYELTTTDAEAVKAFYIDVIGWRPREVAMPGYTLFTVGNAPVAGLASITEETKTAGVRTGWLGYVGVNDVNSATEQVRRLGGRVDVPPREVRNVSRFALVADPQGAVVALLTWLAARPQDTKEPDQQQLDMRGGVGWHELFAADGKKAWPFYGELFGWRKDEVDTDEATHYQIFSVGGQPMGGIVTESVPRPFWYFYFNVGDIDAAARRVKAGGGRIIDGPREVPPGKWIVECSDPQGNDFGLLGKRIQNESGYFGPVGSQSR